MYIYIHIHVYTYIYVNCSDTYHGNEITHITSSDPMHSQNTGKMRKQCVFLASPESSGTVQDGKPVRLCTLHPSTRKKAQP